MATIDPGSNAVVIRVVYDGPALAGKTTSVRTLARGLGGKVVVPEEVDGRTVFFDWLDYTGGLFEGRSIRCQIISVPGQASLAARRRHLLESADVVVFVGDSTWDAQDTTSRYLKSLDYILSAKEGPPVGIVLQANKRDHADAAPLTEIQRMLDDNNLQMAIVESVATEGSGIRETFVFAVRLALDRVRELIRLDLLPSAPPSIDNADELLDSMRKFEGGILRPLPEGGLVHTRLSDVSNVNPVKPGVLDTELRRAIRQSASAETREPASPASDLDAPPTLPTGELPSGLIWPPVEGRMMLHQIMQSPQTVVLTPRGNWMGTSSKVWLIHSPANGRFENLEEGRNALLTWARMHVACAAVVSRHRCVALAADGHGHYRLWQFVRKQETLLDRFRSALVAGPDSLAEVLVELHATRTRALELWQSAGCRIPLGVSTLSTSFAGPTFVGPMPYPLGTNSNNGAKSMSTLDWMLRDLNFAHAQLKEIAPQILAATEILGGTQADNRLALDTVRQFLAAMGPDHRSSRPISAF